MGLMGKRRGHLLGPGKRVVALSLEDLLIEAIDFNGETQPLPTLSPPSKLLLDFPIDQIQSRARGQEGLGMHFLDVTDKDRKRNKKNTNILHREKVRIVRIPVIYFKILYVIWNITIVKSS